MRISDWSSDVCSSDLKDNGLPPSLELAQNPDILAELSQAGSQRPSLVVGFAAETEKVVEHARLKLDRKAATGFSPTTWPRARPTLAATATADRKSTRPKPRPYYRPPMPSSS